MTISADGLNQEELFISYAVEDIPFVRWLAAKLALCGYRVWWDRSNLRGGDSFTTEIEEAIKKRAFRVLAVMSEYSRQKANPKSERTCALEIGKRRKQTLLIPLNLGLTTDEMPWELSDLNAIQFRRSWADGLRCLIEDLQLSGAPCFPDERVTMVAAHLARPMFLLNEPDPLWLNAFPIDNIPAEVTRYEWAQPISDDLLEGWVFQREDLQACWSYEPPPIIPGRAVPKQRKEATSVRWAAPGVRMSHICTSLLRQYIERRCLKLGLLQDESRTFWFPSTFPAATRYPFRLPDGKETWLKLVGTRRVWQQRRPERIRYHIAFQPRIEYWRLGMPVLQIQPTVHLTSEDGQPVDPGRNTRRAKTIRKQWHNDKWLARVAAVGRFLAAGEDSWQLSDLFTTTVRAMPLEVSVGQRLDECARAASKIVMKDDDSGEESESSDIEVDDFDEEHSDD